MAITGWGNFRPLSALSVDALPAPLGLRAGARFALASARASERRSLHRASLGAYPHLGETM
jgi:hypothetical protein